MSYIYIYIYIYDISSLRVKSAATLRKQSVTYMAGGAMDSTKRTRLSLKLILASGTWLLLILVSRFTTINLLAPEFYI